jgi:predicted nucleic acid-binding protein
LRWVYLFWRRQTEADWMPRRRCTIDSSCVIALDHLNLIPQLSFLFSAVLVPKAVREDLFKRRTAKDRVHLLFDEYAFFQRCDGYEKGTVDFLLAERLRQGKRDRGEVEAVVQAAQFGAVVIVDDSWGRELAERDDLEFHGTLWVLQQFHRLELLSSSDLRSCFVSLRDRGLRLPWETVNTLLLKLRQNPL